MGVISVAIADDNERMVEILDSIVKNDNDIQIVGKANNGEDVYHIIKEKEPNAKAEKGKKRIVIRRKYSIIIELK